MIVTTERKDPRLGLGGLFYLVNCQNCERNNSLNDGKNDFCEGMDQLKDRKDHFLV